MSNRHDQARQADRATWTLRFADALARAMPDLPPEDISAEAERAFEVAADWPPELIAEIWRGRQSLASRLEPRQR